MKSKEVFIKNLKEQHRMLGSLLKQLESRYELDASLRHDYDVITQRVERNLKQIKITSNPHEKGRWTVNRKQISKIAALVLLTFCFSNFAKADDGELVGLVKDMQKQMGEMQKTINQQNQKIAQLEQRGGGQVQMAPASAGEGTPSSMSDYEFGQKLETALGGANKWLKDLSFKGDLRLRYEAFQNTSGATGEDDDRNRFRYRLRYGFEKKFSDDVKIGFSMASGEFPTIASATTGGGVAQSDPTSTNTTFDNNFDFKPIYIEKAFATYTPHYLKDKGALKGVTVTAGKMDNPFEKGSSDMVWDRDVKPEGIIEKADLKLMHSDNLDLTGYVTAGQFVLDEDSNASLFAGDSELYALQAGINPVFYTSFMERPMELLSAFSYYNYSDYATNGNFIIGGTSLARGNSNVTGSANDLDAKDFGIIEIYNEITLTPFEGIPVRPFFDWARNTQSSSDEDNASNTGVLGSGEEEAWGLGLKVGSIVKKGNWEASYAYKRIGANAVPGFNDSDFGFAGHSGKRGNVFKLGYALTDYATLYTTAFFVNNLNQGTGGVIDEEQRRFQVDLVWKF